MKHPTSKLLVVALPVLVVGFAWALVTLFELRFAAGDLYPPYSTLRADPLGSKALFDGLAGVRGVVARRFFGLPEKIGDGRDTTLLLLGLSLRAVQRVAPDEVTELEAFLRGGGRIVMAFEPVAADPGKFFREISDLDEDGLPRPPGKSTRSKSAPAPRDKNGGGKAAKPAEKDSKSADGESKKPSAKDGSASKDASKDDTAKRKRRRPLIGDEFTAMLGVSLHEHWGFSRKFRDLPIGADDQPETVRAFRSASADATLPATLGWHTALCFHSLTNQWRTLYARDGEAVIIERPFGKGSIVVFADSWPFSNEALRADRQPALLAWTLGRNRVLLFDETHHGIETNPGVMALLLRFRMHGFLVALLLLAVLYIWKNALHFVPLLPEEAAGGANAVRGKDSASGFVNLLRRGIPAMEVMHVCFGEWMKSCSRQPRMQQRAAEMQRAFDTGFGQRGGAVNPVDAYRELSRIATERK